MCNEIRPIQRILRCSIVTSVKSMPLVYHFLRTFPSFRIWESSESVVKYNRASHETWPREAKKRATLLTWQNLRHYRSHYESITPFYVYILRVRAWPIQLKETASHILFFHPPAKCQHLPRTAGCWMMLPRLIEVVEYPMKFPHCVIFPNWLIWKMKLRKRTPGRFQGNDPSMSCPALKIDWWKSTLDEVSFWGGILP